MIRTIEKFNILSKDYTQKLIVESFDNINELISVNNERVLNESYKNQTSVRAEIRSSWHGVAKFEDAQNLLKTGWTEHLPELTKQISKISASQLQNKNKPRLFADFVGQAPIIPNMLLGVPQTMWNTHYKPKKQKVLHILMDSGVSSSVDTEQMVKWGSKVLAEVSRLERLGYRCRIEILYSFAHDYDKQWQVLKFLVKDEGHQLDLKRVMYPMAHPSMFRAIGFDWEEKLPEGKAHSGKGTPLYHWNMKERDILIKQIVKNRQGVIYVNFKTDLTEAVENVIGKEVKQ